MSELRLTGIRYVYPKNPAFALEADELAVAGGECLAVCGANGSGKTTLGKIAAGLIRPDAGDVLLCGQSTLPWPLGRIGGHIGYLFQEPIRQIFAPTVLEDVSFPLVLKGMERLAAEEIARGMLRLLEIEKLERATTYTLSRGEQQRLAIASMLVNNPEFLVLDEPTTGLDGERKRILSGMIAALLGKGVGVVLISHDMEFVGEHAGVVRKMLGGRLL